MRQSDVKRTWERLRGAAYSAPVLQRISVCSVPGLADSTIELGRPLMGFYGGNGSGKTILLKAIWATLAWDVAEQFPEVVGRLAGGRVTIDVSLSGQTKTALLDLSDPVNPRRESVDVPVVYVDTSQDAPKLQRMFFSIGDLEEFLRAYAPSDLSANEAKNVSELLQKEYSKVRTFEVDELDVVDIGYGWSAMPFFSLEDSHRQYDVRTASLGEVAGLLINWQLKRIEKGSIVLLEEPESFLSETSQAKLPSLIAALVSQRNSSVFFTSHSSRILDPLLDGEVRFMKSGPAGGTQSTAMLLDDVRRHFSSSATKTVVVLVEDRGAGQFLEELVSQLRPVLLARMQIVDCRGAGEITKARESIPLHIKDFCCIGVYDGDMRSTVACDPDSAWPALFLPGEGAFDFMAKDFLAARADLIAALFRVTQATAELAIMEHQGVDHHDWLTGVGKKIGLSPSVVCRVLVEEWLKQESFRGQAIQLIEEIDSAVHRAGT